MIQQIQSRKFISLDEAIERVPAIGAEGPDFNRSDKYTFVSSKRIAKELEDNGFGIVAAKAPNFRKVNPNHGKHLLRFRSMEIDHSFIDPRLKSRIINHHEHNLDEVRVHPEILLYNSSDGSCRYQFEVGLFAMICANGLIIVTNSFGVFEGRHMNFDAEDAYSLANEFSNKIPEFVRLIDRFQQVELTESQEFDFACKARNIRFSKNSDVDPRNLLIVNREEDRGRNLWTVLNRLQENCMNGGFKAGKRVARKLNNLDREKNINIQLWGIAENYCNN